MVLNGKVAIVTGGSRGIGAAACRELAGRGANVVVNFVHRREQAEQVAAELRALGVEAVVSQADVGDRSQVDRMVEDTLKQWGLVDILVNNAGISTRAPLMEITEEQWDEVMRVNLKGTFNCTQAVLPSMIRNRWGRIVNVSTLGVRIGSKPGAHYAAAKGGIIAFTRSAAPSVAELGICINAVSPPSTETDMLAEMTEGLDLEPIKRSYPIGRFATPEEVAAVIGFLCTPACSYVTGETIWISGGR